MSNADVLIEEPPVQKSTKKGYVKILSKYVTDSSYDTLPTDVQHHTRLIIMDTLGAMIAASKKTYSTSSILTKYAEMSGGNEATIIGSGGKKSSLVTTALVNGAMAYYCDIEAHHVEAVMHPAAVVFPAVLAAAEREGASGQEVINAFTIGVDIACRASHALDPSALYSVGQHPTCVAGGFGSCAGVGRILKLTEKQQAMAFGLTGQQACGLLAWETDNTENARPFSMGLAGRNGTYSGVLASLGFGGPPDIFEGHFNIFGAMGTPHPERLIENMGSEYCIKELAIKLFACCAFIHPGLDALLAIMKQKNIEASDIGKLTLRFPSNGSALIDNNALRSHCAQYILPIGALEGKIVIDDFLYDRREEPAIKALTEKTTVVADDSLAKYFPLQYTSIVEIETIDGRSFSHQVDDAEGTPQNPVSEDNLRAKYNSLATTVMDTQKADEIADMALNLHEVSNIRELTKLLEFQPSSN